MLEVLRKETGILFLTTTGNYSSLAISCKSSSGEALTGPRVPCMFSSWHSKPHSARKRMISHIYSKTTIQTSPALQAQSRIIICDRLLPRLSSSAAASKVGVDVHSIFNATAMDFITCYLFGLKNGSNFLGDPREREWWLGLYHSRKTHTFFNQELPRFTRFMREWGVDLVPRWVDDANADLESWTMKRCENTMAFLKTTHGNYENVADEPVVMNTILAGIAKEEKTKGSDSVLASETLKYQDKSIASEMIDHLAAGHETSGITLTYIAWYLSRDVSLQDKLRAEFLTLSPTFEISSNKKELPPSKALDSLPLLHAIIMETLRLNASIPGSQPRQTPYPSTTIGPYTIPGGIRVASSAYTLHRNATVFPNPEVWDPARWLDETIIEEQRRERDRYFWAFSSGGRMCIGSNFAMQELKQVVGAIWTNFRTWVVDDGGMEQEDGYTCGPVGNRLVLRFERVE
jgi:cytochrome P450